LAFLPGEPNRKCREISLLFFFFSFLLLFLRGLFRLDAEISSNMIRAEFFSSVEKSAG